MTDTEIELKSLLKRSNTSRFYCNYEVAWPNTKAFLLNLVSHFGDVEGDRLLVTIFRLAKRTIIKFGYVNNDSRYIDRSFLTFFYRCVVSVVAYELLRIQTKGGYESWDPFRESYRSWKSSKRCISSVRSINIKEVATEDLGRVSQLLLTSQDKRVLHDEEVARINKPFMTFRGGNG